VLKIILAILLVTSVSFAECKKPVSYLQEGTPVPCTGYLYSPEMEKLSRAALINVGTLTEFTVKQDELIKILNQRVDVNLQANENLRKQIKNEESRSTVEKVVYFALGVVLGVGMQKVISK
jgi:hypothetical protein